MKIVYKGTEQKRLDKYLVELEIDELYSRSLIDKLIKQGDILVNDKKEKKSLLLKEGDVLSITIPEPRSLSVEGENLPLDIVYQDDYLAVVNKPAGMTVHPAPGNYTGTLVNALVYHFADSLSSGGDENRPGIVHRLDKDTSGLLIIAKDDKTHSLLSTMFQNREIKKNYKAVVIGNPEPLQDTINAPITRSKTDRKKMTVGEDGRIAITHYDTIESYDYFAFLDINIETGRTHQIRVHFSHINHPVLGDQTYSSLKRTLNMVPANIHKKLKYLLSNHLNRQALHAYRLEFIHPILNKKIELECPLPEDMQYTIEWLERFFK